MFNVVDNVTASDKSPTEKILDKLICGYFREEEKRSRIIWQMDLNPICFMYFNESKDEEVYLKEDIVSICSRLSYKTGNVIRSETTGYTGYTFGVQVGRDWRKDMNLLHVAVVVIEIPDDLPIFYDFPLADPDGHINECDWEYNMHLVNLGVCKHNKTSWISQKDHTMNMMSLQGTQALSFPDNKGDDLEIFAAFKVRNDKEKENVTMNEETHLDWDLRKMVDTYPDVVTVGKQRSGTIHSELSDDKCWYIAFNASQGTIAIGWWDRSSIQLKRIRCTVLAHIWYNGGGSETKSGSFVLDYKDNDYFRYNFLEFDEWAREDVVVNNLKKGKVIKKIKVSIYVKDLFIGLVDDDEDEDEDDDMGPFWYPQTHWKYLGVECKTIL